MSTTCSGRLNLHSFINIVMCIRGNEILYLTSLSQLHSVITVHRISSFWITNPSLRSSASFSKARWFIADSLLLLSRSVVFRFSVKSKSHCDWRSVSQSVSLGVEPPS
jgi:hypothetical protein